MIDGRGQGAGGFVGRSPADDRGEDVAEQQEAEGEGELGPGRRRSETEGARGRELVVVVLVVVIVAGPRRRHAVLPLVICGQTGGFFVGRSGELG